MLLLLLLLSSSDDEEEDESSLSLSFLISSLYDDGVLVHCNVDSRDTGTREQNGGTKEHERAGKGSV